MFSISSLKEVDVSENGPRVFKPLCGPETGLVLPLESTLLSDRRLDDVCRGPRWTLSVGHPPTPCRPVQVENGRGSQTETMTTDKIHMEREVVS